MLPYLKVLPIIIMFFLKQRFVAPLSDIELQVPLLLVAGYPC